MPKTQFKPGDTVIVTGAAQGFGRGIALRLAEMNASLALWDVNLDGAAETASLCSKKGAKVRVYCVDLGEASEIEAAAQSVKSEFGLPFGLVNNGAIFPRSPLLKLELGEWERVLRVNLTGAFVCARNIAPMMVEGGRGTIISISSGLALRGDPNGAHYSAAKAGLISLTKSLAQALAPSNIRANCIIPGVSDTAQPLGAMTREQLLDFGKTIPLQRIGQPEDIAGVVAFLLGADAAYITGQAIAVNGGAIMVP